MRAQKRGYKVVAVAVAGLLLAAGCGGGDDEDPQAGATPNTGAPTGEIAIQNCKPQNPLIPSNTNEVCGGDVLDQVTAKLVRYDPDSGEIENDIAESIETKNSKVFTIKLQNDGAVPAAVQGQAYVYADCATFVIKDGAVDVTAAFIAGTYVTPVLAVHAAKTFTMTFKRTLTTGCGPFDYASVVAHNANNTAYNYAIAIAPYPAV